jgi:hypothetical protein
VLLATALLAGCGGSHTRRNAVNAYFDQVDRAQQDLLASAGEIDKAFASFQATGSSRAQVHRLGLARVRIDAALRRVRAVDAPREAAKVQTDLVALLSLESAVANELVSITRYVPQLARALAPLHADAARLAHDLAASGKAPPRPAFTPARTKSAAALNAYAAAFGRYGRSLGVVLANLERLDAPPVLRPTLLDEQRTLRRSSALCRSIVAALRKNDLATANAGVRSLFAATSSATAAAARQSAAAAVGGYQARLKKIATLGRKITRERQQLVEQLG